mgnify:CR=1 FL=1
MPAVERAVILALPQSLMYIAASPEAASEAEKYALASTRAEVRRDGGLAARGSLELKPGRYAVLLLVELSSPADIEYHTSIHLKMRIKPTRSQYMRCMLLVAAGAFLYLASLEHPREIRRRFFQLKLKQPREQGAQQPA